MNKATSITWVVKLHRVDLPLGVYFHLPEQTYHDDIALGSGDMARLAASPEDFWFESKMNPLWEPSEPTPAQKYGSAMHKMILEGRGIFETLYAPCEFPGNVKAGIEERKRIAGEGKLPLRRADWDRIEQLKASVDLKNISSTRNISFPETCRRYVAEYACHIQAEHYREGRMQIGSFVMGGNVYDEAMNGYTVGGPTIAALRKIAAQQAVAWVLVFCQSSGAPLTWGAQMSAVRVNDDTGEIFKNPLLDLAAARIAKAEDNWHQYQNRFGPETPWLLAEPLQELAIEDFPPWAFQG